MNEHEKLNYVEFASSDLQSTKAFFEKAFGWSFVDYGPEYTAFSGHGLDGGFFKANLCSSTANGAALLVFYSNNLEVRWPKLPTLAARSSNLYSAFRVVVAFISQSQAAMNLRCGPMQAHNHRINTDSPPQRSFVANATSLTPLRPAGYAKR